MKVLRALHESVFSEFRVEDDVNRVEAGELLVLPPKVCANAKQKQKPCLCTRSFIGTANGGRTTLAMVAEGEALSLSGEFLGSSIAREWWCKAHDYVALSHLIQMSYSLSIYEAGQIVRVSLEDNCFHITPFSFEEQDDVADTDEVNLSLKELLVDESRSKEG